MKSFQGSQGLQGKILVLFFEKKSTRTRLSITAAWSRLGGTVIDMSPNCGSHIGTNESLYDSFRVISEMSDCIVARVQHHKTLLDIQEAIDDSYNKPFLINGLCDKHHPLQILADILTMCENETDLSAGNTSVKQILTGKTVTWIGDVNNVMNELVTTLPRFEMNMRVCTALHNSHNAVTYKVTYMKSPVEAIQDANYIITDTWVSMGSYVADLEQKMKNFAHLRVDKSLILKGKPAEDYKFLHCLPRHAEEVSDDIFYSSSSLVFEEAENRLWTVMGVFMYYFNITADR